MDLVVPHALLVVIRRVTGGLGGFAASVLFSLPEAWKEPNIV